MHIHKKNNKLHLPPFPFLLASLKKMYNFNHQRKFQMSRVCNTLDYSCSFRSWLIKPHISIFTCRWNHWALRYWYSHYCSPLQSPYHHHTKASAVSSSVVASSITPTSRRGLEGPLTNPPPLILASQCHLMFLLQLSPYRVCTYKHHQINDSSTLSASRPVIS